MRILTDKCLAADRRLVNDNVCLHSGARCRRNVCRTGGSGEGIYHYHALQPDCCYGTTFGTGGLCRSLHRGEYSPADSNNGISRMLRVI